MQKPARGSESGAAAIEFALVAMPLIILLGAIIEVSIMLVAQFELQHAVETATRQIRTGAVTEADGTPILDESDFRSLLCSRVVLISNCAAAINIDVRNAADFASLEAVMPQPIDVGPENGVGTYTSTFEPGGSARPGTVVATFDWSFVFPFLGVFSNLSGNTDSRRIYGLTVFMNEPF